MKVKLKRFLAIYLDILILGCITIIPLDMFQKLFNNMVIDIICGILWLILFIFVLINKDNLFGYISIGKRIMGLKIYYNNTIVKDKKLLKKRNIANMNDFYTYVIDVLFDNKSEGDVKFNTEVK